jgi:hypothetical protein
MKKSFLLLFVAFLTISGATFGKSKENVEVLYFKANLCPCKARVCNALQAEVDSVLKKNFAKENIQFKVIQLADEANKELIAKYKAESQTVVIVKTKGKKETVTDVSAIVKDYAMKQNKEKFETELKQKISESLK